MYLHTRVFSVLFMCRICSLIAKIVQQLIIGPFWYVLDLACNSAMRKTTSLCILRCQHIEYMVVSDVQESSWTKIEYL